jgi:hypothetical protein
MRMDKPRRNEIIEATEVSGLPRQQFGFDFDPDGGASITHTPSGSNLRFVARDPDDDFTVTAVIGDGAPTPSARLDWSSVPLQVRVWAREVKDDVDTPDLWAELQGERELLTGDWYDDAENTPFTEDEQAKIADELRQIKEQLEAQHSLDGAQMRALEEKVDYLIAASGRMGRKDWLTVFYGTILQLIVMGLVPPDAVQQMLHMTLNGLGHIFHALGDGWQPPQVGP